MDYAYSLRIAASKFGKRRAIAAGERSLSFGELDEAVDRYALALETLAGDMQPVATLLQNAPETIITYLALARIGRTCVPINPRLHHREKAFVLANAGVRLVVADAFTFDDARRLDAEVAYDVDVVLAGASEPDLEARSLAAMGAAAPAGPVERAVSEHDVATIIYTSGTTGAPKGVRRTHRANLWNIVNSTIGIPRTPDDVELFCLPLFGIGFFQHAMPTLFSGGTLVLEPRFDPARSWELMVEHNVTFVFLAPTMINSMLAVEGHERFDVGSLRAIGVAYEFPRRLRLRALERFGDIFINQYGLTEAQLCSARIGQFAAKPTSVGKPMGLARIAILGTEGTPVDAGATGEIAFDGPTVMSGYHDAPEASSASLVDGWVRTGDLGFIDEDGDLHFAGRIKEIIKTGGYSVDPVEVENVILDMDAVREACVVGVGDEHWGEAVVAVIVMDGAGPGAHRDIVAYCKQRLSDFKVPKRVVFIDDLPKNATGKVERGRLRSMLHPAGSQTETS